MAITLKKIAELAGVTPTAVSLALRDSKKISKKTKEKIFKIMKEYDYFPNLSGKNLRQGKTNTIALLSSFFHGLFKMDFTYGIESVIINSQYKFNQYYANAGEEIIKCKEILFGKIADIVITLSVIPNLDLLHKIRAAEKHIILVEDTLEGFPGIAFNNYKAAYNATEYLIKKGRKKIAFSIADLKIFSGHNNVDERVRGYKDALKHYGITFHNELFIELPTYSFEIGKTIYDKLKGKNYDALFCASGDLTAAGFLKQAIKNSIKIPDDIALIGFDDSIIASITTPALTTIKQPAFEMGKAACNLAISLLENKVEVKNKIITFEPELVIRESA